MHKFLTTLLLFFTGYFATAQSFDRYEVVNMGKDINTHYHEAAPVVSPDGKTLYFFVDGHPENTFGKDGSQDIWVSRMNENGDWGPAEHLRAPFNNSHSNQVFTVMKDGTLFIKGGKGKDEKGFSLITSGGGVTELDVKDFSKMNAGRFYGATMSADKKHIIIYFSESKGSALSDLYVSHAQGDGSWSRPMKLKISHSLDDFAPFISPDQKTMYYASGRPGEGRQGGADIYSTKRLDDTWENWSTPVNLGRPINTSAMDAYFSIDEEGRVYVARSNSRIDGGNLDLFRLVPKELKINLVGVVFNEKTKVTIPADVEVKILDKEPLHFKVDASGKFETKLSEIPGYAVTASSAGFLTKSQNITLPKFEKDTTLLVDIYLTPVKKQLVLMGDVYNKKTNELMSANVNISLREDRSVNINATATGGKYENELSQVGWYTLVGSSSGFLNATDSIFIPTLDVTPVIKDLYLQPIEVGVTVRLRNVYFDFDKTTLKSESFSELNKVVDFLQRNGSVEIEIAGHTDSKGSDDYNRNLSQGRCQSVVDYLVSQGIESYRLTPRGYGEAKPIDTNDTDDGRANNRRVEFTVLKK